MNNLLQIFQKLVLVFNYATKHTLNEKKLIKDAELESGAVFDVGSNLGTYIEFVNKYSPTNHDFHSFEPLNDLCELQKKKFVKLNIKVNNIGISNNLGIFHFYRNSISSQSSFIKMKDNQVGEIVKSTKSEVTTIDSYCEKNNIGYINILKIDTEGFDFQVLESAKYMLENRLINLIKIEISNEKGNFGRIFNFLEDFNYELLGFCSQKLIKNETSFVDAYFKVIT